MSNMKFLTPFATALVFAAAPAHAYFSESTSGLTTTLTENFNGSGTNFTGAFTRFFYDQNGPARDGVAWLQAGATGTFASMSLSFTSDPLAALTLDFWYAGSGSVSLSNSAGTFYSNILAPVGGTNPGVGVASLQGGGPGARVTQSFSNLAAGEYTLSFTRFGTSAIKLDDVSLSVTAVPEPSTIALMLAGLSIVGFAAHRNKRPQ